MPWSIFSLASLAAHGRMIGDESNLWAAIGVLFVAIFLIGGALIIFLVKAARDNGEPTNGRYHGEDLPAKTPKAP